MQNWQRQDTPSQAGTCGEFLLLRTLGSYSPAVLQLAFDPGQKNMENDAASLNPCHIKYRVKTLFVSTQLLILTDHSGCC